VQFNTYTYAGAHIAAWLVNHPSPEAAATPGQVRALGPWARQLRAIFEAGTVAGKAQRADELLVTADCRPRLVSHGPGLAFHFHYAPVRTGLAARVKALTAAGLAHVVDDGAGSRLRACSRDGCGTVFIDTSRNGRRHFCTVRCANQVNVANHRRRRRREQAR
jgi:predicted RNA-binding Zn ribbon-like protein